MVWQVSCLLSLVMDKIKSAPRNVSLTQLSLRAGLIALSAVMLSACATAISAPSTPDLVVERGGVAPRTFLVTVMIVPSADVSQACDAPQAALACARSVTVFHGKREFVLSRLVFSRDLGFDRRLATAYAHETCHALAAAQRLVPDPCHNEDHGTLTPPRRELYGVVMK